MRNFTDALDRGLGWFGKRWACITNGVAYWGSGDKRVEQGITNNKVYAFSVKDPNGKGQDR